MRARRSRSASTGSSCWRPEPPRRVVAVAALQLTGPALSSNSEDELERAVMITRRSLLAAIAATLAATSPALAAKPKKKFVVDPVYAPQPVEFPSAFSAGTIVVDTA